MSSRPSPRLLVKVGDSVRITAVTLAGVSLGYVIWKWLGDGEALPGKWSSKKKRKLVPGLLNVGNSCFMNVLLQAFSSSPSFLKWLDDFVKETENEQDKVYLAEVVLKIMKVLSGDEEAPDYYDPSELLRDMAGRGWHISSQEQDCHEFYHAVMTTLIEEYRHHVDMNVRMWDLSNITKLLALPFFFPNQPEADEDFTSEEKNQPNSRADNAPFRGTLASILQCQACGFQNPIRYDEFSSLSLSLPDGLSWSSEITLTDCLRGFTSSEIVSNVECENCFQMPEKNDSAQDRSHAILDTVTEPVKGISSSASKIPEPSASEADGSGNERTGNSEVTTKKGEVTTISKLPDDVTLPSHNDVIDSSKQCGDFDGNGELSSNNDLTKKSSENSGDDAPSMVKPCSTSHNSNYEVKSPIKIPFPRLTSSQKESFRNLRFLRMVRDSARNHGRTLPRCSLKQNFCRRVCIGKLPKCLCIHLQRLVWVRGTPVKKMNFVKFPEILDVSPFTDLTRMLQLRNQWPKTECFGENSQPNLFRDEIKNLSPLEKQKLLLTRRGMRSGVAPPLSLQGGSHEAINVGGSTNRSPKLYRLTSAIVHVGDWSFSGHFLAYRRSPEDDKKWIFTSDAFVRKATREEVFSCPAYMLFYERITQ